MNTQTTNTTLVVTVRSYKKAQVFKKDYVRKGGEFIKLNKLSGSHKQATIELEEGEEFDARGSEYKQGATRWTASNCQSWSKFRNEGGELVALNYDGDKQDVPHWVSSRPAE